MSAALGESDHVGGAGFDAVSLGGGGVCDAWVGALTVVVEPESVEELLEVFEVEGGSFVGEPVFEGAMEPFQLPEGLGVIRRRVDHLDAEVFETLLEHHFGAVQPAGGTQPVVRQHLAGQPISGSCRLEGVPGQLPGR